MQKLIVILLLVAVRGGADLVRKMEITFVGEARRVTEVEARVRDSVDGRFDAPAHVLAVRLGLSPAEECFHPVAALSSRLTTILYVGNAGKQVLHYVTARHRCFGCHGCTRRRRAHDEHHGSQL
ncbi:hypothetical protein V6N13_060588 [Hibiscus sabdariffa]